MGYHKREIKKGVYGELSKIREELEELEDAVEQDVHIMVLVELSDLVGALEAFAMSKYDCELDHLVKMSRLTKKAFEDGSRK